MHTCHCLSSISGLWHHWLCGVPALSSSWGTGGHSMWSVCDTNSVYSHARFNSWIIRLIYMDHSTDIHNELSRLCGNTSRSTYSLPDEDLLIFTLWDNTTKRHKKMQVRLYSTFSDGPFFRKPQSSIGSKVHLFSSLLSWEHLRMAPKINTFPAVVGSVTAGPVPSAESGPILDVILST